MAWNKLHLKLEIHEYIFTLLHKSELIIIISIYGKAIANKILILYSIVLRLLSQKIDSLLDTQMLFLATVNAPKSPYTYIYIYCICISSYIWGVSLSTGCLIRYVMQMCRYCRHCRRIGDDSNQVRLPRLRSLALGVCVANSYLPVLSGVYVRTHTYVNRWYICTYIYACTSGYGSKQFTLI